jgi:hypothetical protein
VPAKAFCSLVLPLDVFSGNFKKFFHHLSFYYTFFRLSIKIIFIGEKFTNKNVFRLFWVHFTNVLAVNENIFRFKALFGGAFEKSFHQFSGAEKARGGLHFEIGVL